MTRKNIMIAGLLSLTALGGAAVAADTMGGPRGPMRADTNQDGSVSRSEFFAAAEARFKKRDANGDRKLTGDELKRRGGFMRMRTVGTDAAVTFDQLAAQTSERFKRLDANADGKLTPEEMGPRHGRRHGRGGGGGMAMFARADANNDGRITRDEFRSQADTRFARLDANRDGVIDRAELPGRRGPGRGGPDGPPPPPGDMD